jgi:hypothetical protein
LDDSPEHDVLVLDRVPPFNPVSGGFLNDPGADAMSSQHRGIQRDGRDRAS